MQSEEKEIDLSLLGEVARYLNCNAKAIDLPPKHSEDSDFPFTILDRASGVGKTQQAFAFLRKGYNVSYINLSETSGTPQLIYAEMKKIAKRAGQTNYLTKIKDAMGIAAEQLRHQDWSSLNNVARLSDECRFDDLENCFDALALTCKSEGDKNHLFQGDAVENSGKRVLFVDEALPHKEKHSEKGLFSSEDILRFVCNFGRVSGWRVVVAGTAATVANMIAEKRPTGDSNSSRGGLDRVFWAENHFIYSETESTFLDITSKSRPFVSEMMSSLDNDGAKPWATFKRFINIMKKKKEGLDRFENNLVWLSGAWLDQRNEKPVSPFALSTSDLVSGHFFEPAISLLSDTGTPYLGYGLADTRRCHGPLKVSLLKLRSDGEDRNIHPLDWCILAHVKGNGTKAYITKSWGSVAYFLSHCVQQCLDKEPFLAVGLSLASYLTPPEFQYSIAKLWHESATQRSVGNLDGELFEYTAFAALQLACRKGRVSGETETVGNFFRNIFAYLAVVSPHPLDISQFKELLENYKVQSTRPEDEVDGIKMSSIITYAISSIKKTPLKDKDGNVVKDKDGNDKEKETLVDATDKDHIKRVKTLLEQQMPWMIPCCMPPKDSKNKDVIRALSKRLGIAALVPGENNSAIDATAFPAKGETQWMFEFKGRTSSVYSFDKAFSDLKKKVVETKCHALLIATTTHQKSECKVWLVEDKYLRVAMQISNHHKIVDQRRGSPNFALQCDNDVKSLTAGVAEMTVSRASKGVA